MAEVMVADFQDAEVRNFLKNIDRKLSDIKDGKRKYSGLLSSIVFADVTDHFAEQKGSAGPWKKWSNSYAEKMNEAGKGGNKILQDSGRLRQNFKPTNVKYSSKGYLWFNDAVVKSGFPYASAHDKGDKSLPQREFMWLSDKAMDKVSEQTLQFMLDEGI